MIERRERQVARARGYGPRRRRARVGLAPFEPAPRVEQRIGASSRNRCLVTISSRFLRFEVTLRGCGSPLSTGRPSATHFWQAAVEDGDLAIAEVAEHEPAARRGPGGRIVVDDDPIVAPDAELLHRRAESPALGSMCGAGLDRSLTSSMSRKRAPGMCASRNSPSAASTQPACASSDRRP